MHGNATDSLNAQARLEQAEAEIAQLRATLAESDPTTPSELKILRMIAENADQMIIITDGSGMIEWVNQSFVERTGCDLTDARGRRPDEVMPVVGNNAGQKQIREWVSAGQPFTIDRPQLLRGEQRWIHIDAQPVFIDGACRNYLGFHRDVTERVHRQQALEATAAQLESALATRSTEQAFSQLLINTIPGLLYWKGKDLRYLGYNAALADSFARRGIDSAIGCLATDLTSVAHHVEFEGAEQRVLETGTPILSEQVQIFRSDPQDNAVYLRSIIPWCGADGSVNGIIGVAQDITHVTQLEQQLLQSSRLESIGQLAAGVAHEINTPVQYVSDNTTFAADAVTDLLGLVENLAALLPADVVRPLFEAADLDYLRREAPLALQQSSEGLQRVGEIVRAMKDFSHPGGDLNDADLNQAVENTLIVSRNEWKYTAELNLDLDSGLPPVPCREGEIKQVLLNIMVNAAHAVADAATSSALGRIDVSTRRKGEYAQVIIADSGVGMDPDVLGRVFDPFFTTKEVGRGTGQGLSLAYQTVRAHGGSIEIESEVGVGTTFTVNLPLTRGLAGSDPSGSDADVNESTYIA